MNKFKNKRFIFMLMMFFTISFSLITEAKIDNLEQGKELFLKVRGQFYNSNKGFSEIIETAKQSISSFEKIDNKYQNYYWRGQVEFLLAEIYEIKKEPRKAAQHFEESNNLALKAIKEDKKSSEAHCLLADTYMRLMPYKGFLYMMTSGPKAFDLLQKAVKINPKNYTALNSLGTYYLNAPKIGGGDLSKGIKTLNKALASNDKFDNFISYIWLGNAYAKQKDKEQAIFNIEQALNLYPQSQWAENLLKEFKEL